MKELPRLITSGILLSTLFFTGAIPALALDEYQTGATLFSDDFSDGNYDGWTDELGTGRWSVQNGTLYGVRTSILKSGRMTNTGEWSNYSIEADINNNSGVDEGVGFRRKDTNNAYEVTLRHGTGRYNTPEIVLNKIQSGVATTLKSTHSVPLTNNIWYHLKIEAVDEHIQVSLNSALVFEVDDLGTTVKTGPVSLSQWSGDYGISFVQFDNVKVASLSKKFFPVIFIPGIGGSEFKANQDIYWGDKSDGHGGVYSHAYTGGEKIWVNADEAIKLGDDDYFDVLRLKADGVTSEAAVSLTGNLTSFGYPDIDSFFQSIGYEKGKNFFVYPYDWRKDIKETKADLDALVEEAKSKSGMPKVNIVAHSMGGLVARNYIADQEKANKVNKLIGMGVPHLGAVKALKTSVYGIAIGKPILNIFTIGVASSEVKDVFSNLPSAFELHPVPQYYSFYDNSSPNNPFPFYDDRDIDQNKEVGALTFPQTRTLLSNLGLNMTAYGISEAFHQTIDQTLNQNNSVKLYNIVGSGQPTLGQIREGWLINWPIKLIPKYDEIYVNGDETVPLYSASLKSDAQDLSAGARIYYVEQVHTDLTSSSGLGMQTVKVILAEGDSVPVEVKDQKITLEGNQISVDQDSALDLYDEAGNHTGLKSNGELESNIPCIFYDSLGTTTHVFIKKSCPKITTKVSSKKPIKTNIKIRRYSDDKIDKTTYYKDVPLSDGNFGQIQTDPPVVSIGGQVIPLTGEASGTQVLDNTPPITTILISGEKDSTGNYIGPITITLTALDTSSGVLRVEYTLDGGQTVNIYTNPIVITTPGNYQLQIKSIDKMGNEEIPQTFNITIIQAPTPSPTASLVSSNYSDTISQTPQTTPASPTPTEDIKVPGEANTSLPQKIVEVLSAKIAPGETSEDKVEQPSYAQNINLDETQKLLWLLLIPALFQEVSPLALGLFSTHLLGSVLRKHSPE